MAAEISVVKVLVRNQKDKFLVVKEAKSGKWELPGGKIEPDENRLQAASRELKEETDLESSDFEDVVRVEVEDEDCVNCWIVFTEVVEPDVSIEERELKNYRWATEEEYRTMDWHADAGYGLPAMVFLEDYLS